MNIAKFLRIVICRTPLVAASKHKMDGITLSATLSLHFCFVSLDGHFYIISFCVNE